MKFGKTIVLVAVLALAPVAAWAQDGQAPAGACSKQACPAQAKAACVDKADGCPMMAEMKEADARLQQKLDAMNAAADDQKVQAMQAVIDELMAQRKMARDCIAKCASEGKCGKKAAAQAELAAPAGGCCKKTAEATAAPTCAKTASK